MNQSDMPSADGLMDLVRRARLALTGLLAPSNTVGAEGHQRLLADLDAAIASARPMGWNEHIGGAPAPVAEQELGAVAWMVWWGIGDMRPAWPPHRTRHGAEEAAAQIKSNTEVRPLFAASPGSEQAMKVLQMRFFRDLTSSTRFNIFQVFGVVPEGVTAEDMNHSVERLLLDALLGRTLSLAHGCSSDERDPQGRTDHLLHREVGALKPCPFCARAADLADPDTLYPGGRWREDDGLRHYLLRDDKRAEHGRVWYMHCPAAAGGCGAQVSGHTRDEAIAAWDRRADAWEVRQKQLLSALRHAIHAAWITGTPDFRRHYDAELLSLLDVSSFWDLRPGSQPPVQLTYADLTFDEAMGFPDRDTNAKQQEYLARVLTSRKAG